jgi:hypothetical protein
VRLRKSTPAANGRTGCDCQMTVQVTIKPAGTSANDSDVLRLGPLVAMRDVELHLLAFLQAAVAGTP